MMMMMWGGQVGNFFSDEIFLSNNSQHNKYRYVYHSSEKRAKIQICEDGESEIVKNPETHRKIHTQRKECGKGPTDDGNEGTQSSENCVTI